jgi:hypothetical protein
LSLDGETHLLPRVYDILPAGTAVTIVHPKAWIALRLLPDGEDMGRVDHRNSPFHAAGECDIPGLFARMGRFRDAVFYGPRFSPEIAELCAYMGPQRGGGTDAPRRAPAFCDAALGAYTLDAARATVTAVWTGDAGQLLAPDLDSGAVLATGAHGRRGYGAVAPPDAAPGADFDLVVNGAGGHAVIPVPDHLGRIRRPADRA